MKLARVLLLVVVLAGLWIGPSTVWGQGGEESCPAIVESALVAVDAACGMTGRNQACYGHVTLEAEPQEGVSDFVFEQEGDLVDVATLHHLRLSAMDVAAETWGVALLRIQADLPETLPGQNVTLVLFGDVEVTNAVEAGAEPVLLDVVAAGGVNIRSGPSTNGAVLGSLAAGETAVADGRLADGTWLRVRLPGGGVGWVFAELVSGAGDLSTLAVVEAADSAPVYGPMQAFYFRSGLGDAPCAAAPESGLLIQTPAGATAVTLMVNEVTIQLGSTIFLQAGEEMIVNVVEGRARVTAFGVTQTVPAGGRTTVPLDEDQTAAGPPTAPEPYDEAALQTLPLSLLERAISVAPAASETEIAVPVATPEVEAPVLPDSLAGIGSEDACTVTASSTVNLRGGPGTSYPVQGQLGAGETANPDGQATGTDDLVWWRLTDVTWVRSDVVQSAGNCGSVPVVEVPAPEPPSPLPAAEPPDSGDSYFVIVLPECSAHPTSAHLAPLRAGQWVSFATGCGCWSSPEEAQWAYTGAIATITVDGTPQSVFYQGVGPSDCPGGFSGGFGAYWLATPGTHMIYENCSGPNFSQGWTCALFVE